MIKELSNDLTKTFTKGSNGEIEDKVKTSKKNLKMLLMVFYIPNI